MTQHEPCVLTPSMSELHSFLWAKFTNRDLNFVSRKQKSLLRSKPC
uniref:Uncharacterized protein n=1 Tax=Arundo donax TaxID=35708 RepID=A0A0A9CC93_ARUDO